MSENQHVTEIAVREQEISPTLLTTDQLKFISATEFVPKAMRGNLPAILACVATGRALGLPDMTALRSIYIIDGKSAFSAELMTQLVRQRGHSITFTASGESCTTRGRRIDNGDEGEFTWTLEMAQRAGLLGKQNWKAYPEAMLYARSVSQLCRMLFSDCFAGQTYTPDEAEEMTADELMEEPDDGDLFADEPDAETVELTARLYRLADEAGNRARVEAAVAKNRGDHPGDPAAHADWLRKQIGRAEEKLAEGAAA